ncbi:BTB domain-containing protein [Trichonephila clavipes]|nr:BTB domain-containing protein [Trichonephila clavipes]
MVYLYVTARQLKQTDCTNRAFKLLTVSFERLVMTKQFLDLDIEQVLELFSCNEIGARRAKCNVGRTHEHHTADSTMYLGSTPNLRENALGKGQGPPTSIFPATNHRRGISACRLFKYPAAKALYIYKHPCLPRDFKPRPYGTAVSVAIYYTG